MRREQHVRQLVDVAKEGTLNVFVIGALSPIVTWLVLGMIDSSKAAVIALGFVGVIPLLFKQWRLDAVRKTFNVNATYQRLVRLPFWLTTVGLLLVYGLMGYGERVDNKWWLVPILLLCATFYGLHRLHERTMVRIEPDYITDRELQVELKN